MSFYNNTKRADRLRCIADRKAELTAIDSGEWPRDYDDLLRWGDTDTNPFSSYQENQRIRAAHAKKMCLLDIRYLEGIPARVLAGELPGWEG